MYTPRYHITNKILKYIGIIETSKHVIDTAALLPYYEKKFQDEAMVRSVYHGTHLEGNELNLTQAEKVMLGQDVTARERDVQEVINYREVMEYIGEMAPNGEERRQIINEAFIKALHKLTVKRMLTDERAGKFRDTQVVIKNSQTQQVSFRPPPASEIEQLIRSLVEFVNDESEELHSVLKAGLVHFEFVRIHPFVDGNGRVGRALTTAILFQEGYDIRRFFSLEEYYDRDAARYYQALQSVEFNQGDVTEWLEYFVEGLAIELSKIKDKVEQISRDIKLKDKLGGKPLMLTDRQLKIIEYIQSIGFLQNNAFKSLFPFVSEDTVLNELKVLIQSGLIKKHGSTKAAKYILV